MELLTDGVAGSMQLIIRAEVYLENKSDILSRSWSGRCSNCDGLVAERDGNVI
jgi:hypothetical protein